MTDRAGTVERFAGWFGAATIVAGVGVLDPTAFRPFTAVRWYVVVILVVLAGAAATMTSLDRRLDRRALSGIAPLAVGVSWIGLVTVIEVADGARWWGTDVRHLGLIAWASFVVAAWTGVVVGRGQSIVRNTVDAALAAAFIVGGYGLVEWIVGRPIDVVGLTDRLGSTFGSASYSGAAIALIGPIVATIAMAAPLSGEFGVGRRFLASVASVVLVIVGLGTGSRALIVATLASAAFVLSARGSRTTSWWRPTGRWLVFGTVGLVTVVAWAVQRGVFERTAGATSRLAEWRIGLRAFAEQPLSGYGTEGYRLAVPSFVDDAHVRRFGDAFGTDRAHLGLLDVGLVGGVPAMLAMIVALAVVGGACWRVLRDGVVGERAIALGVASFFVHQQLLFPLAELDPAAWFLAGVVIVRSAEPEPTASGAGTFAPVLKSATAVAGAFVVAVIALNGLWAWSRDQAIHDAVDARDPAVALDRALAAVDFAGVGDVEAERTLAIVSQRRLSLTNVDIGSSAIQSALMRSPNDPHAILLAAESSTTRAMITGSAVDQERAADAWDRIVEAWPSCRICHEGRLAAALDRGDRRTAEESSARMIDLTR